MNLRIPEPNSPTPNAPVVNSGGSLVAGAGPLSTHKNFPEPEGGRGSFLGISGQSKRDQENRDGAPGAALRTREIETAKLKQLESRGREPGSLDNNANFSRVRSVVAPIYNPKNDPNVFIVELGKQSSLGMVRYNDSPASERKPNPAAINANVAVVAGKFANAVTPANTPAVLFNGGYFDGYHRSAHGTTGVFDKQNGILNTGAVGPNQKVLWTTGNDGKGFEMDTQTRIGVGELNPRQRDTSLNRANYQQDFAEMRSATDQKSGMVLLSPEAFDKAGREERQRQLVIGVDNAGKSFVLASSSKISLDQAIEYLRGVGCVKFGVGDAGNSTALSARNDQGKYVHLVDSYRAVNSTAAVYLNRKN
jgi:hypothetical protein